MSRRRDTAACALAALLAAAAGAQTPQTPPVPATPAASAAAPAMTPVSAPPVAVEPPQRFERVLWCADAAAGAALARSLSFTAIQLGRAADPAPVLAAGLGFYLDQPIGKGVLELRDDPWLAVRDAYERTRDGTALVRPGCWQVPGVLERAALDAAAEAARVRGPALRFVALADEASATRHDAPLDTCRCEHCIAAFRAFAERRFGGIDAANRALGTQFPSFVELVPPTTDQVRRRELGDTALPRDLRAFTVWLDFVDEQWAHAVRTIAASVQHAVPGVPVGLTGLGPPAAFGGNDPSRWAPPLTLLEPYAIGGAPELMASLAPRAHRYATLGPPAPDVLGNVPLASFVHAQVAAMACGGLAGVVVWNAETVATGDGTTPFGAAVQQALRRHGAVLDACAGAVVEHDPVWLVESHASVRAWWMLDSAGDGMTWPRRLASHERTHSTSQAARVGWLRLLQDLGLQPRLVPANGLAERLLRERPRVLVLPATLALSDRDAQAIGAYTRGGGTVLADHGTGLYDETLVRREHGALDELFGIEQRSLRWDDLLVREGRSTARGRGLPLAERGLRGRVADRTEHGDAHVEQSTGRGRTVYFNAPVAGYPAWRLAPLAIEPARELRRRVRTVLDVAGVTPPCEVRGEGLPTCIERVRLRLRNGAAVLAVRLNALDAPAVLQQLAAGGPRTVRVELPATRTLRALGGDELGTGTSFECRLDPFGVLLLEVVH